MSDTIFDGRTVRCRVCERNIILNGVPDLERHMEGHSFVDLSHAAMEGVEEE